MMRYKTYELDTDLDIVSLVHEGDDRSMAILCAEERNEMVEEESVEAMATPGMSEEELEDLVAEPCTTMLGITWDTKTGKLVYWEDRDTAGYPPEKEEAKPETETENEN